LAQLSQSNRDLRAAFDATLQGLARMLEIYDYETEKHSFRVVDLTVKLAQYMGITGSELDNIRHGAYMHDIGKIGIPVEILNKDGKLTPTEWEEIYKHPQYAHEIIEPIPFLRPALDIPYSHHERWNGKGYPRKLAGEQIPLAARIFAVVDIFDALTSARKYRQALSAEEALDYIKNTAGVELDPKVTRAFLELYPLLKKNPFDPAPQ
jgi:HD-GYP domain-containing protein (c-di-GMP phosphodiesterase class II)